jgi:cell division protein FtsA
MSNVFSERLVVAIDIGTTKICVLVAQHLDNQALEIIGIGHAPSDGLRKGVVVDIGKTVHSIKQAVKEAELMAGVTIESAYIGVSGGHISSLNSSGVVPIHHGEVRAVDISHVLAAARAIPIPEGQQILHVLPQYFIIDSQEKVHDPIGMSGIRLEVQAHIITGAIASVQNLVKCCEMAGVKVNDIILEQLASADAVLSEDERELGVAMIDIGGGTSDVALYQGGSIRHTMVLPVAGNHFTNDVAIGLRTPLKEAERIKKEYGCAWGPLVPHEELIEVRAVEGNRTHIITVHDLHAILAPRSEEIFTLIHEEILKRNVHTFITAGFVLTGGGSLLKGMRELAHDIFKLPIRIGTPRYEYPLPETLNSPMYATAYGLLLQAIKKRDVGMDSMDGPLVKRVFSRMKMWVSDFF